MATVEQLVTAANAIAARMALYDSRARHALEAGDRRCWRHWIERALREQAALDSAKARITEARRVETLRGGLRDVAPGRPGAPAAIASAASSVSSVEARRTRALIGQSQLVLEEG
ncbi:MAG: hypothetical protein IT379_39540 [Deltaproteobacteria bacterium]|nr:hypothetical protein [Deltaproteobacteria bacterium]